MHLVKTDNKEHPFFLDEEFFENFTSHHTRKNYLIDINQFLEWISYYYKFTDYDQIRRIHIIKFRNYLSETGGHNDEACSPKTINRKLASLSTYFNFLVEKNLAPSNPVTLSLIHI